MQNNEIQENIFLDILQTPSDTANGVQSLNSVGDSRNSFEEQPKIIIEIDNTVKSFLFLFIGNIFWLNQQKFSFWVDFLVSNSFVASTSNFKEIAGWSSTINIEDGISKMIKSFYNEIRVK